MDTGETSPAIGWQVRVLPFAEQQQLWDQVKPLATRSTLRISTSPSTTGPPADAVPYTRCPSDGTEGQDSNWAQTNYTGSLGSTYTPSNGEAFASLEHSEFIMKALAEVPAME